VTARRRRDRFTEWADSMTNRRIFPELSNPARQRDHAHPLASQELQGDPQSRRTVLAARLSPAPAKEVYRSSQGSTSYRRCDPIQTHCRITFGEVTHFEKLLSSSINPTTECTHAAARLSPMTRSNRHDRRSARRTDRQPVTIVSVSGIAGKRTRIPTPNAGKPCRCSSDRHQAGIAARRRRVDGGGDFVKQPLQSVRMGRCVVSLD
jgi:hypothetical protein